MPQSEMRNRVRVSSQALYQSIGILLDGLEEDFAQGERGDIDGAGVKRASALHHLIGVAAGEDAHLIAARADAFYAGELEFEARGIEGKNQIDLAVGLAYFVERDIGEQDAAVENANVIGNALHFFDLM